MDVKQLDEIMMRQLEILAQINEVVQRGEPELVAKNAETMLDIYLSLRSYLQASSTFDEQTQ
ncbi:MAG: hypothetical protein QM401_07370 [Bacillota bacterium]|nr:hypothetical protein [Bacillota bacterium]